MEDNKKMEIALFRYGLIADLFNDNCSQRTLQWEELKIKAHSVLTTNSGHQQIVPSGLPLLHPIRGPHLSHEAEGGSGYAPASQRTR